MELLIGTIVSLVVQAIKSVFEGKKYADLMTLGTLLGISLLGGLGAYLIKGYGYTESFISILTYSSAIWALIIRRLEK